MNLTSRPWELGHGRTIVALTDYGRETIVKIFPLNADTPAVNAQEDTLALLDLIVAAPDLLKELKNAARANRNLAEMVLGQNHTYRDEVIKIAERQEAVIARAERRS